MGQSAGLSNETIFLRFLGMIPNGTKFFLANEARFKTDNGLSEKDLIALFVEVKQKLAKSEIMKSAENDLENRQFEECLPGWVTNLEERL